MLNQIFLYISQGATWTRAIQAARETLLTEREHQVMQMLCKGKKPYQIAKQLSLSVRTIEHHMYRTRLKLEADDRGQAMVAYEKLFKAG